MITALFGLLGVIVGGVLGGLVQLRLEKVRNRNLGEAAAALISEELLTIAARCDAFVASESDWTGVISTDAWDAYKTPILLAVSKELGYAIVTTYTWVEGAVAAPKSNRRDVAYLLSPVSRFTGQSLLDWHLSGHVAPDLNSHLARVRAEAEKQLSRMRETRVLEVEERWLIRTRNAVDRAARIAAVINSRTTAYASTNGSDRSAAQ